MWTDQQTSAFKKVPARRRYVYVAEQIVDGVAGGQLHPGQQLPSDRVLAETMGVSRPTVREALLALEVIGVLDVRPGSGTYVAPGKGASLAPSLPLPSDLGLSPAEVIEARITLEPALVRLCATRLPPDAVRPLEELLDQTESAAEDAGRLDEFLRLGLRFHSELAPYCGNQLLASFCSSLVDVIEHPLWALVNRRAMQDLEARREQVAEHRAIIAAVARGDEDAAAEEMATHLNRLNVAVFGAGS